MGQVDRFFDQTAKPKEPSFWFFYDFANIAEYSKGICRVYKVCDEMIVCLWITTKNAETDISCHIQKEVVNVSDRGIDLFQSTTKK